MKYFIIYKEDSNFDEILHDYNIKKLFDFKLRFSQHLILGGEDIPEEVQSYILLKYGDDIKNSKDIFIDRKPLPFIDYTPDSSRPTKFKKL